MAGSARAIVTTGAPRPRAAYSQGKVIDGIFATVQIGDSPVDGRMAQGIRAQTQQTLANITAVLAGADMGWGDVLKTTCYLADVTEFPDFDRTYGEIVGEPRPARSTVGVVLAAGILVEIEAVAVAERK